jgi:hypothetical protein
MKASADQPRGKALLALVALPLALVTVELAEPAGATTVKGSTTDVRIHLSKPTRSAYLWMRAPEGTSVTPLIENSTTVAYADAGATGQGATDEECEVLAGRINLWNAVMEGAFATDDFETATEAAAAANHAIEETESAGCFIVWKQRPDEEPVG